MSGESTRTHEEAPDRPVTADATQGRQSKTTDDRVGHYGGDDGALEHERTEVGISETLTPDDSEVKAESNRKPGR
jgi:hypothetical protein